jgi:ABC-type antimicrobial peptide transport system permease subunit
LYDVQFMRDRVAKSLKLRRFIAGLLNGLAGTGFLLAIVGLYGSLAHLVELRQREIGIRVALGATRARIVQIILRRGAIVVAAGLIIGAFTANFAAQAIRSQMFGVELTDAVIWLSVLGAMLIAGAVSAYLPAWRAARIDPSVALRHE